MPFFPLLLFCYWQNDPRIKNELENIYDQLEPQFFSKIGFSISHYSKCHTPFGVSLHHFTMGLVYISPSLMQSITNTDKKKEKRKGSPIPLSCEVLWWGKILVRTGCGATHLSGSTQHFIFSSFQYFSILTLKKIETLQHCAGSILTLGPWQERDRFWNGSLSHFFVTFFLKVILTYKNHYILRTSEGNLNTRVRVSFGQGRTEACGYTWSNYNNSFYCTVSSKCEVLSLPAIKSRVEK